MRTARATITSLVWMTFACSSPSTTDTDARVSPSDAGNEPDAHTQTADAAQRDGGHSIPDSGPTDECEALREAPFTNRAQFELFDQYPGKLVRPPLLLSLDGCVLFDGDLERSGSFGHGFLPGERTLTITVDGVELPPQHLSVAHNDVVWFGMEGTDVPEVFRAEGSIVPSDNTQWTVHVMNMGALPVNIERALDPDAVAYAPLAIELEHGETFNGELPVFPETGMPVRITRASGEVIFEDNIGNVLSCERGEWVGGVVMFVLIDDTYPRNYVVYPGDPCDR